MKKQKSIPLCSRIKYGAIESPVILLGIILEDTLNFLKIKTAHREYLISKRMLLSVEQTKIPFDGDRQ